MIVLDEASWYPTCPQNFRVMVGPEATGRHLPDPVRGMDSDNDSVFVDEILTNYCADRGIESSGNISL